MHRNIIGGVVASALIVAGGALPLLALAQTPAVGITGPFSIQLGYGSYLDLKDISVSLAQRLCNYAFVPEGAKCMWSGQALTQAVVSSVDPRIEVVNPIVGATLSSSPSIRLQFNDATAPLGSKYKAFVIANEGTSNYHVHPLTVGDGSLSSVPGSNGILALSTLWGRPDGVDLSTSVKTRILIVNTTSGVGGSVAVSFSGDSNASPPTPPNVNVCSLISRSLSSGMQGNDVRALQEFLREKGHLSASATGYFGSLTTDAVTRWQASQGLPAAGVFGPISRERLKALCGDSTISPPNPQRFSATPSRGDAPLTVTFSTWISGFRTPNVSYIIDFGDGLSENVENCLAPADACISPGRNMHGYATNGTYSAVLYKITDPCAGNTACRAAVFREEAGKVQIIVGSDTSSELFSAAPLSGAAPLSVRFTAPGSMGCVDGPDYVIDFGDGTPRSTQTCGGQKTEVTHTYATNGSYTAILNRSQLDWTSARSGGVTQTEVGRLAIRVGPQACTMDYTPVCGLKPIVCITTPCNPVPTTYSNRCGMEADGATFSYAGECRPATGTCPLPGPVVDCAPGYYPSDGLDSNGCQLSTRCLSSATNTATSILNSAKQVETAYLKAVTDVGTVFTQATTQLRSAENQCWSNIIPKVCPTRLNAQNECIDGRGASYKVATSTAGYAQGVINAKITPLVAPTTAKITLSLNALRSIENLILSVSGSASLEAQRLAIQQLDNLVAQHVLHVSADVGGPNGVVKQLADVRALMNSLVQDTVALWANDPSPTIGWCNVNNPTVIQGWKDKWRQSTITPPTPTPPTNPQRVCSLINRSLSSGMQGDDVRALQEFLRDRGHLSANATGYFGSLTAAGVAQWQTSQGVSPLGIFGPASRERLMNWCNGDTEHPNKVLTASPAGGQAPLLVSFRAVVDIANPQMVADAGSYKITFGDGAEQVLPCSGSTPSCVGPQHTSHTYAANGMYTASLVHFGYFAPPGDSGSRVVDSVMITVGSQACTKEYTPVCGSKQVQCITAPCNPVQETYSNRCMLNAAGASFVREGTCAPIVADPAADPKCKAWYDGCNTCSRSTKGGQAMCTLRACLAETNIHPYCTAYFTDADGNQPPAISAFSGPTTLAVNASGTWSINASDPEQGELKYMIQWGDEWYAKSAYLGDSVYPGAPIVQSTSFTHSYASAGNYTVKVLVRDAAGNDAKASATVQVGATTTTCSDVSVPVCGRPTGCANTCAPGMYCATMCTLQAPVTYPSACHRSAANATALHDGVCTANDAMLY